MSSPCASSQALGRSRVQLRQLIAKNIEAEKPRLAVDDLAVMVMTPTSGLPTAQPPHTERRSEKGVFPAKRVVRPNQQEPRRVRHHRRSLCPVRQRARSEISRANIRGRLPVRAATAVSRRLSRELCVPQRIRPANRFAGSSLARFLCFCRFILLPARWTVTLPAVANRTATPSPQVEQA